MNFETLFAIGLIITVVLFRCNHLAVYIHLLCPIRKPACKLLCKVLGKQHLVLCFYTVTYKGIIACDGSCRKEYNTNK